MIRFVLATVLATLAMSTSLGYADISRTDQSVRLLYESTGPTGNYLELSYVDTSPEAKTTTANVPDPLQDYSSFGFGYLYQISDNLSIALIYDTPYGAHTRYQDGLPFFGGFADIESDSLTFLTRYKIDQRFSVHAGIRALEASGSIYTNTSSGALDLRNLTADSDTGYGFVLGGAYEIPEIALRVSLTYNSAIDLSFTGTETPVFPFAGPASNSSFDVEFPESVSLEFQSGVAEDTLVFASIRHVAYDGFNLTNETAQYVGFTSDSTTYTLGAGYQFNPYWSGSVAYTYREKGTVPSDTALAPVTGLETLTLAARYEEGPFTVSAAIIYGEPGDQIVENNIVGDVNFRDNEVVAAGLRVGYRF